MLNVDVDVANSLLPGRMGHRGDEGGDAGRGGDGGDMYVGFYDSGERRDARTEAAAGAKAAATQFQVCFAQRQIDSTTWPMEHTRIQEKRHCRGLQGETDSLALRLALSSYLHVCCMFVTVVSVAKTPTADGAETNFFPACLPPATAA